MKSAARAAKAEWRWNADRAVDKIRDRFGWEAVQYGSALGLSGSVPDAFRKLAETEL
jgi:DNA polymerase-4